MRREQDGPDVHNLFNKKSLMASAARIVDTMQQYPMADGYIWDGPEWGYEIAARHQNHRSCKPLHALVVSCAAVHGCARLTRRACLARLLSRLAGVAGRA